VAERGRLARVLARGLGLFALFLLTVGGVAEVVVRQVKPTPRTQVLRADELNQVELLELHGEPVWRVTEPDQRSLYDRSCRELVGEQGRVVVLVGDSILYMTGTERAADNVARHLEEALGGVEAGWCVVNGAMSGYSAQQKLGTALDLLERERADLVLWEVWGERPTYRRIGQTLYGVGSYARDETETPYVEGLPVPLLVNRWLFRRSRAWEYAVLALGAGAVEDPVLHLHERLIDEVAMRGAQALFVIFPDLGQPFDQPPSVVHLVHEPLRALAAARQVPLIELRPLLIGQDVEALRLDPCCHYNPKGHEVVGRVLAGVVRERFRASPLSTP
jgi:hypothetical protein